MSTYFTMREKQLTLRQIGMWGVFAFVIIIVAIASQISVSKEAGIEILFYIPLALGCFLAFMMALVYLLEFTREKAIVAAIKRVHTYGLENNTFYFLFVSPDSSLAFKPIDRYQSTASGDPKFGVYPITVEDVVVDVTHRDKIITSVVFDVREWAKAGNVVLVFTGDSPTEPYDRLPTQEYNRSTNSFVHAALLNM